MVSPRDSMEAVARAVAKSGDLPEDMGLVLHEADMESSDADIDLPTLEVQPVEVDNIVLHNTDFIGYVTDNSGNRIGRIYQSEYEMTISMDLWTEADGNYSPDNLGEQLRKALYPYSSYGPQHKFEHDDGTPIDEITYFRLAGGERSDDIIQTPTVRRWTQEVELWGYEEFRTDLDYITKVTYPESGDFNGDDGTIEKTFDVSG